VGRLLLQFAVCGFFAIDLLVFLFVSAEEDNAELLRSVVRANSTPFSISFPCAVVFNAPAFCRALPTDA